MDVNRVNGYPAQGSGDYAHAPPPEPVPVVAPAAPPPVEMRLAERAERPERSERTEGADALRRAVDEINSSLAIHRRHLGIRFHEPTNRRIVTVYDSDTNEALREIPPERILEAHANMLEMVGLFVNERG